MIDWAKNKIEYRKFCRLHGELPIFFQDWWLDVVCEKGNWEVCLSKDKGGNIRGVLPFYISRYFGIKVIKMPDLTPYLGVWLEYPKDLLRLTSINHFEKETLQELIQQLPKVAYYAQRHSYQLKNWLPFYWEGFQQTTFYTNIFFDLNNLEDVYNNFKKGLRSKLQKSKSYFVVEESDSIELFYNLKKKTFIKQNQTIPYTLRFLNRLDIALNERNSRKIYLAKDKDQRIHAAAYFIWDQKTVYNMASVANTQLSSKGAARLLLWEGIQWAAREQKQFDFEGSMMPNIDRIFSEFGARRQSYHKIYKESNTLFQVLNSIRKS